MLSVPPVHTTQNVCMLLLRGVVLLTSEQNCQVFPGCIIRTFSSAILFPLSIFLVGVLTYFAFIMSSPNVTC